MIELIKEFLISEQGMNFILEASVTPAGGDVDDGPRWHYGNKLSYETQTRELAEKIGFKVIDYIMGDRDVEYHDSTDPPTGPPLAVSFFPAGIPGDEDAGTNYLPDIKSSEAFKHYVNWIKQVALKGGVYFVDFIDAEMSKEEAPVEEFN